ncbi:MAG TPA: hypothetical protein PK490_22150 [Prosthecobacter sp.]|nr:hypothetical protein [Prosthecobacter sp.]HRK17000.1 hypothetical protein [Prosthecobacter sp.]
MKTPAASTTRCTQGLTSGGVFTSLGSFMKNLASRELPPLTQSGPIHPQKIWTNLICPHFMAAKQCSPNSTRHP